MKTFQIKTQPDWHAVAAYLLDQAVGESETDSVDTHSAWEKAGRLVETGGSAEATKYSALVIYRGSQAISLLAAIEPQVIHLSMAQVLPGPKPALGRLSDAMALEAAAAILGRYEERIESVMPQVRHFYRVNEAFSNHLAARHRPHSPSASQDGLGRAPGSILPGM
jgi:hypothetical protein